MTLLRLCRTQDNARSSIMDPRLPHHNSRASPHTRVRTRTAAVAHQAHRRVHRVQCDDAWQRQQRATTARHAAGYVRTTGCPSRPCSWESQSRGCVQPARCRGTRKRGRPRTPWSTESAPPRHVQPRHAFRGYSRLQIYTSPACGRSDHDIGTRSGASLAQVDSATAATPAAASQRAGAAAVVTVHHNERAHLLREDLVENRGHGRHGADESRLEGGRDERAQRVHAPTARPAPRGRGCRSKDHDCMAAGSPLVQPLMSSSDPFFAFREYVDGATCVRCGRAGPWACGGVRGGCDGVAVPVFFLARCAAPSARR